MPVIAIDSHVHFHSASGAIEALSIAKEKLAGNTGRIGVVMLAERQGFNVLDDLGSSLIPTEEPEAFWFDESRSLLILAGRQIISAEKLEILTLATTAILPDGLPAVRIVAEMDAADAIVVLPWGVGKWIGKRGMLVDRLIAEARPGRLFLGDNSGRPGFWPVRQFNSAIPVLSGSDPLPLPGWQQNVARLVSVIDADLPSETPAAALKAALRNPAVQVDRAGSLAGAVRFVTDQAKLRLYGGKAVP